ncbi:transformer-2 protein homolog beta-like [Branchiostoma floridae]|uniref:Transformer-2 protein homolog beta-like n=1 Tax=Branchiostoma floridae TaxID=7739 RepID=A0A9J7LV31_BRAFL|nr:transformer-2 protein homolog beta-like [Branchiostoma floridae]
MSDTNGEYEERRESTGRRSKGSAPRSASRSASRSRSPSGSNRSYSRSPSARAASRSPSRSRSRSASRSPSPRKHSRASRSRSRSRSYDRRRRYSRSRSRSRSRRRYRSRSRSPRRSSYYGSSYGGSRYRRSHSRSPMSNRRRHVGSRENPTTGACLGVFGLSLYTSERDLREVFSRYGPLQEVQVVYDQKTGRSRGFAFVYFQTTEDAVEEHGLSEYLEQFGVTLEFPANRWKHIVKAAVGEKEEEKWDDKISGNDLVKHMLTECRTFQTVREEVTDHLTDFLGIRVAVEVHQQGDERLTGVLLGAHIGEENIETEHWEEFILLVARKLRPLAIMALKHITWK